MTDSSSVSTAISDDEMSDVAITSDVLPKKTKGRPSYKEPDPEEFAEEEEEEVQPDGGAGDDDDEEGAEDMDDDEYVVEKIFSHYIAADVRCLRWMDTLTVPPKLHELTVRAGQTPIRSQVGGLR